MRELTKEKSDRGILFLDICKFGLLPEEVLFIGLVFIEHLPS